MISFFKFRKPKKETPCTCGNACAANKDIVDIAPALESLQEIHSIKVLGAGCKSCHVQYQNAKAAIESLGLSINVEYITDMEKVMEFGIMRMPAVVLNEQVISQGKVLSPNELLKILRKP